MKYSCEFFISFAVKTEAPHNNSVKASPDHLEQSILWIIEKRSIKKKYFSFNLDKGFK